MSKTSKIRRARKARDRALVEAANHAHNTELSKRLLVRAQRDWNNVVEVIKAYVPANHIIRAMVCGVTPTSVDPWHMKHGIDIAYLSASHLGDPFPSPDEFSTIHLEPLLINVWNHKGAYRCGYVIELRHGDDRACYAMDREALAAFPKEELVKLIANALVDHLKFRGRR